MFLKEKETVESRKETFILVFFFHPVYRDSNLKLQKKLKLLKRPPEKKLNSKYSYFINERYPQYHQNSV